MKRRQTSVAARVPGYGRATTPNSFEGKLDSAALVLARARDASMPLLGLFGLHEKLVGICSDEANGDVLNWYEGYYSGSVQEAMQSLAKVVDSALDDLEGIISPMLSEVSHGKG